MKMNFSVPVVALLVGAALGFLLKPDGAPKEEKPVEAKKHVKAGSIAEESGADVRALRIRVKELERLLADQEKVVEAAATQNVAKVEMQGPRSFREHMEKLKKENPEQYQAITNNRARFRKMHRDRTLAKTDFLSSLDISGMNPADRENHKKYQVLLARREAIMDELQDESLSEEDRHELHKKMGETFRQLNAAANQERNALIVETARAVGLSDDDCKAVADTIKEVISATDMGFGPPPPPPQQGGPR